MKEWILIVFPIWEFPKIRGTIFGGPYNKDYNILGSVFGSPYLGKLPYDLFFFTSHALFHSFIPLVS